MSTPSHQSNDLNPSHADESLPTGELATLDALSGKHGWVDSTRNNVTISGRITPIFDNVPLRVEGDNYEFHRQSTNLGRVTTSYLTLPNRMYRVDVKRDKRTNHIKVRVAKK